MFKISLAKQDSHETVSDWSQFRNFSEHEFGGAMNLAFMQRLQRARTYAERICGLLSLTKKLASFPINSGFRTVERNQQVGGKDDSAHLIGRAADIGVSSSRSRFLVVAALLLAGFTRIGIAKTFIHVDNAEFALGKFKKDKWVLWLY